MKIRLISDTHVNFYSSSKPLIEKLDKYFPKIDSKNELLILAGDIGQATRGVNLEPKYVEMLEYFKSRWEHIILVPGNHEWYNSIVTFQTVDSMIRRECKRLGIIYLNKNTYEYKDYVFVGCTLWSRVHPKYWPFMKYKYENFLPYEDMLRINDDHISWIDNTLYKLQNKKVIVITHHLPTQKLIGGIYTEPKYRLSNTGYYTNLEWLIKKYPFIEYWFCGHSHINKLATVDKTVLYLNPIGTPKDEDPAQVYRETLEIL